MEIDDLTSLLAMMGGLNIFYALFSLTNRDFINTLVPTLTYLVIMYIVANIDDRVEELRRRAA